MLTKETTTTTPKIPRRDNHRTWCDYGPWTPHERLPNDPESPSASTDEVLGLLMSSFHQSMETKTNVRHSPPSWLTFWSQPKADNQTLVLNQPWAAHEAHGPMVTGLYCSQMDTWDVQPHPKDIWTEQAATSWLKLKNGPTVLWIWNSDQGIGAQFSKSNLTLDWVGG